MQYAKIRTVYPNLKKGRFKLRYSQKKLSIKRRSSDLVARGTGTPFVRAARWITKVSYISC
jgi:hypothetical protein